MRWILASIGLLVSGQQEDAEWTITGLSGAPLTLEQFCEPRSSRFSDEVCGAQFDAERALGIAPEALKSCMGEFMGWEELSFSLFDLRKLHGDTYPGMDSVFAQVKDARTRLDACLASVERVKTERVEAALHAGISNENQEQERRTRDEEDRRREEIEARHARDPKWMQITQSAFICSAAKDRTNAKKEIATELRYAREGGGVVDKEKLHDLQQTMRRSDETVAFYKKYLSRWRIGPVSCSLPKVVQLVNCFEDHDTCASGQLQELTDIFPGFQGEE